MECSAHVILEVSLFLADNKNASLHTAPLTWTHSLFHSLGSKTMFPPKPRPCRKQLSVVGVMGPSSACSPVLATTLDTRDASSPSCESRVTVVASSTSGGDVAKTSKRTAIFVERATYVVYIIKQRTSSWLEDLQYLQLVLRPSLGVLRMSNRVKSNPWVADQ